MRNLKKLDKRKKWVINLLQISGPVTQNFWELVAPFISEGIKFLRRTQTGQIWVQNLYANVFKEEHDTEVYGPERAGQKTKIIL